MTIRLFPAPVAVRGDADPFELHERARVRAAAHHARRVLPGVVGELVHRELTAYADFGFRFASDALIPRLADEILTVRTADPQQHEAARPVPLEPGTPGSPAGPGRHRRGARSYRPAGVQPADGVGCGSGAHRASEPSPGLRAGSVPVPR
jgi:hypothetical protein